MRKSRLQILEEDLDECFNILEIQYINQLVAMETTGDIDVMRQIGGEITSYKKRIEILERLIVQEKCSLDLEGQ